MTRKRMIDGLSNMKQGVAKLVDDVRLDAVINEMTGFGTSRDKTTYGYFSRVFALDRQELSDLYHGDAMAARIADILPEECMRKGFQSRTGDTDVDALLAETHRRLGTRGAILEADRWAGVFGGAVLLIGANDGNPSWAPLEENKIKSIGYLFPVDCRYIWPLTYYSRAGDPKMGQAETYMVTSPTAATSGLSQVVHESRLIRFGGAPTAVTEQAQMNGWDYSVLQKPYEVIRQFNTGWTAVEHMLTDANQAVFKMSGLADALASGDNEALKARIKAVDMFRSVMRAIVVDAGEGGSEGAPGEEFARNSTSFADIPATLEKLCLRLAGSVPMPVTFLMGQSPSGMSATGESDFRWFYDRVDSRRENIIAPKIRRLNDLILASAGALAKKATKNDICFPPLWSLDPLQESQRRAANATADAAYVVAQVYMPEEIALSRSTLEGYGDDIIMSNEARAIREERTTRDVETLMGESAYTEPGAELGAELGAVETGGGIPIELAPTTISKILTANAALKMLGESPAKRPDGSLDPDGNLPIDTYAAKKSAEAAPPQEAAFEG